MPSHPRPTVGDALTALGRPPLDEHAAAGTAELPIAKAAPLDQSGPEDLTFCTATASQPDAMLARVVARMLLVDATLLERAAKLAGDRVPVIVGSPTPRLDFARLLKALFSPPRPTGIHPSAVLDSDVTLGVEVYVGPLATVGPGVVVGDRTTIHAGVHIHGPARIGADVTIQAGTVIGASGYGYERAEDGTLEPFPQIGGVEIGDGVEIGANVCIDRAALGTTRIGARTRIDNLVHIAHNVQIGADCAVIANAMLGGSTQVGDRAWIAPSATIREQRRIGEDATVGLGAVVLASVPPGATVVGNPARDIATPRT